MLDIDYLEPTTAISRVVGNAIDKAMNTYKKGVMAINEQQETLVKEISEMANDLMADWPSSRNMQKQFILEYVATGFTNASEAARNAGYSEKSARSRSSRMLAGGNKLQHIADTVENLKNAYEERQSELKVADGTEVLQHLTRVMRREEKENVVVTLRTKEEKWVEVAGGQLKKQTVEEEHAEVVPMPTKVSDTNKAAELLGKRYAMWTDKQEVEADLGLEIVVDYGDED